MVNSRLRRRRRTRGRPDDGGSGARMKAGLVGYALVGKTTLFNAFTGLHRDTVAGPGHANLGPIKVSDPRVDAPSSLYKARQTTYAATLLVRQPRPLGQSSVPDAATIHTHRATDALSLE